MSKLQNKIGSFFSSFAGAVELQCMLHGYDLKYDLGYCDPSLA